MQVTVFGPIGRQKLREMRKNIMAQLGLGMANRDCGTVFHTA